MEADALPRIRWAQVIEPYAVKAIINAAVERPDAPMEVYAFSVKACEILQIEPPPEKMTLQDCTEAQMADPVMGQVMKPYEERGLDTTKISINASAEQKQ